MNNQKLSTLELQAALHHQEWDRAEEIIADALAQNITHDQYGVPLHFLQSEILIARRAAAIEEAGRLTVEAERLAEEGKIKLARERYENAAALLSFDRTAVEEIDSKLGLLGTVDDFDPALEEELRQEIVELLDRIEQEQYGLAMLLRSCAIPLWWDQPLLRSIRSLDDDQEEDILKKLSVFSFILRLPEDHIYKRPEYYVYSRGARPLLLQRWEEDGQNFHKINRRILDHFEKLRHEVDRDDLAKYEQWELSYLYHLLLDTPHEGVGRLMQTLRQAEESYLPAKVQRYVVTLQDTHQRLPQKYYDYMVYVEGWMHTIQERPRFAQKIFGNLLEKDQILPDVRARVQRHLGIAQVDVHQWSEAIPNYRKALARFEELGNLEEAAHTMERLGFAYMDIAAQTYNHEDYYEADDSWMAKLVQTVSIICYLPLILYVLNNFKFGWNPRAWWRWGQDMDWIITKYFALAIHWFEQAEENYEQMGYERGLNQVRTSLGRLYLNLHYTDKAAEIFEKLESEYADGTYQQAYVRLQLASALFEEGQYERCEALLDKALSVFRSLEYNLRIAQAQTLLGKVATRSNKPDSAMQAYTEALENWQSSGNEMMATTVIHNMEGLAAQSIDSPSENWLSKLYASFVNRIHPQQGSQPISQESQTLLDGAQQKSTDRVYESRFIHPLMRTFLRTSFIILCFFVPLVLWFSIRTEADTNIGATAVQSLPAQQQLNKWETLGLVIDQPEVAQIIERSITPEFKPEFFGRTTITALLIYLVIYTAIGLYLLRKTEMSDVESDQAVKLRVNRQGVSESMNNQTTRLLNWSQISLFLNNNRSIFRWPINFFSKITLVANEETQIIRGYTKGYIKTIEWVQQHLPQHMQQLRTGFSLLYSVLGWLALSTITLLLVFIVITFKDSSPLTQRFIFDTYAITDLYNILSLGIYIPLLYWFVLQPLRGRLAYHVEYMQQLWLIACLALALSIMRFVQFECSLLMLNRPELLVAATAILLGVFVLRQLYHAEQSKLQVAKTICTAVFATLAIGLALFLTFQEFMSFHSLVKANHILYEIADNESEEAIEEHAVEYKKALAFYKNSNEIRETAVTLNSQGNVYLQLAYYEQNIDPLPDHYEQAIKMYKEAIEKAPHMPIYQQNLALVYREWATQTKSENRDQKVERYQDSIKTYSNVIQHLKEYPYRNKDSLLNKAYELRAATYFDLGLLYYPPTVDRLDDAIHNFNQARADYEWLIKNYKEEDKPKGYIGRGWALRYLQSQEDKNTPERRQYLEDAIEDFNTALQIEDYKQKDDNDDENNENYIPDAYNGLGWIRYAISQDTNIRGDCIREESFDNDQSKADYIYQIESAVAAFTDAISADPNQGNGYFFRTRAQLQYILGRCGEPYTKIIQDHKAILDYHQALKLDPDRTDWRYRLGRIHYGVGLNLEKKDGNEDRLYNLNLQRENSDPDRLYKQWDMSAKIFLEIIKTDPDYDFEAEASPLKMLDILYKKMDLSTDELAEDIIMALGVEDTDENLINTAQAALDEENHELAYLFLKRVTDRTPEHNEALLILARTTYQWATQYDIENQPKLYQDAIKAANRTLDVGIENVELYTILARSHADQGDEQEAVAALQKSEPLLQTDDPLHRYLQGVIHVSRGDAEAAKSAYEQGIELMEPMTDTATTADIYAQAIGDVLLLPISKESDEAQLKLAGQMATQLAEAALKSQGVSYTNRDEAWNAAESARKNKDYEIAIPRYIKALTFAPDDFDIRLLLRNVLIHGYGMNGVTSGAAALTATLGVSEQPDAYDALLDIVKSELVEDTFGLAVVALERAQQLKPNDTEAFLQHANIYLRWGEKWSYAPKAEERYTKAAESVQQALELDSTNLEALLILAHAYVGLDQADEAVALVTDMLEKNPDDVQAKLMQAHIDYKQEYYDEALATVQEILDQDEQYTPAYLTQISIYHANGEYQKAADAALKIIEIDPTNRDAHLALGRLYRKYLKEYDQSLAAYREVIELDALDYRLFWTMSWDSHYGDASPFLYNTFMANGRVLGYVGWNAYTNKEYELSVEASQEAIGLMPDEPRHYGNQGVAYIAMGDIESAQKSYLGWIEAANRPVNSEIWLARLNEAIGDLRGVNADPENAAQQFIDMLEEQREREDGS